MLQGIPPQLQVRIIRSFRLYGTGRRSHDTTIDFLGRERQTSGPDLLGSRPARNEG